MGTIVQDGFDGVDDHISIRGSTSDTLVSSTYGGNDIVTPDFAHYLIHLGEGNDTLNGGYAGGSAWGEEGNDRLVITMWEGDHNLYGGSGDDDFWAFIGDAGTVHAYGGAGHDLFREGSDPGALHHWSGGAGFDVVVNNSGSAGIALTLDGTGTAGGATGSTYTGVEGAVGAQGADTLTGSSADNLLIGDTQSDLLYGGAGDDFLIGEVRSVDFVNAYRGIKSNFATENPLDPLNCNASGLYASDGGGLNDSLYGGKGNDVLAGGDGADLLSGGTGSDWTTYLSATGSVALNLSTGGTGGQATGDVFISVENAQGSEYDDILSGTGTENELRGMGGQDSLLGRDGADTLLGGEGRDTLVGGAGSDSLTGGNWEDAFVFTDIAAVDQITDMQVNHDEIWLARKVFDGIGPVGALAAGRFVVGDEATTGFQRIIYDDTTGALSFDADGKKSGEAVQFAQLAAGLDLTAADFVIFL